MKPTDDLLRIASVGGGIDMRHHNRPTEDLVRIASIVGSNGGLLFINGSKPTDDLVRIASVGEGRVVVCFEP
jgi:predicted RNA-binding protein YlxR (DUF448 family)